MNNQEREVISGIFQRLEQAANQPRDPEAERLIADRIRQQPYAPYAMAQTIVVQEQALTNLYQETEQLRAELERLRAQPQGSGGFLSNLFGGGTRPQPQPAPYQRPGQSAFGGAPQPGGPWGGQPGMGQPGMGQPGMGHPGMGGPMGMQPGMMQGGPWGGQARGGSGFLGTAMATVAGVAGGMMLGNALSHAFSGAGEQVAGGVNALTGAGAEGAAAAAGDFSNLSPFGGQDGAPEAGVQDAGFDQGGDFGGDFDSGGGDDWA